MKIKTFCPQPTLRLWICVPLGEGTEVSHPPVLISSSTGYEGEQGDPWLCWEGDQLEKVRLPGLMQALTVSQLFFSFWRCFFDVDHFISLYWICYILLLFHVLIFWPLGMWYFSSLKRDWTCTPGVRRWSLLTSLDCQGSPLSYVFQSSYIEDLPVYKQKETI